MKKATKLIGTIARKIGLNKGKPRVWLEGTLPQRAGFTAGARYTANAPDGEKRIVLKLDDQGIRLVSSKSKADRTLPVIDLNSAELLGRFDGMNAIRVVLLEGEIHILPCSIELKKLERRKRLEEELANGEVSTASVSHGAGILSHALHTGLENAGLKSRLKWACEIDEDYMEHAARVNPAWDADTIAVNMPLQQLGLTDDYTLSRLPKVSILDSGLPCTAASRAGRSKKGLAMPEDDETVGHLVAGFIALVARINPAVVISENVVPWAESASGAILRNQLRELGYNVHEKDLHGEHYAIEARVRRVIVGVTEGLEVDLEAMLAPPRAVQTLGSVLDDVALDDPMWRSMQYLKDKEVRDAAAGKGFAMCVGGPSDTRVGTQGRGYAKCRSTEIKLQHPENPDLLRLLTVGEHARIKGIPESLIAGVTSATRGHELLGQSVIWPAFRHLGEYLGNAVRRGFVEVVRKTEIAATAEEEVPSLFAVA